MTTRSTKGSQSQTENRKRGLLSKTAETRPDEKSSLAKSIRQGNSDKRQTESGPDEMDEDDKTLGNTVPTD